MNVFLISKSSDREEISSLVQCENQFGDETHRVLRPIHECRNNWTKTSWKQLVRELFLPKNFPASVSEDYLEYQVWDSLQALFSSVSGTLATYATLKGLGVGESSASVTGATWTWMLKTSSGMISSIVFAYFQSSSLDAQCKQWRLFADIMNDLALGLAIVSPLFDSSYFVLVSCVSSMMSALVGVAGDTTRAALRAHQARDNNMADVCAKDNSQEHIVNLIGIFLGFIVTSLIDVSGQVFVWSLFVLAVCSHLFCNYRAVKCVVMETLNPTRFHILVSSFWRSRYTNMEDVIYSDYFHSMDVKNVNSNETAFFWNLSSADRIVLGVPVSQLHSIVVASSNNKTFYSFSEIKSPLRVGVSLSDTCCARDVIKARFVAEVCVLESGKLKAFTSSPSGKTWNSSGLVKLIDNFEAQFDNFEDQLNSHGWKTDDASLLMADNWRFSRVEKDI